MERTRHAASDAGSRLPTGLSERRHPDRAEREAAVVVTELSRDRLGWWIYVFALAGAALYIGYAFVGILVLGVFGYYAMRPIRDRFKTVVDSRRLAAASTVVTVLVPVFVVIFYAGFRIVQQLQSRFDRGLVSMLVSGLTGLEAVPGGKSSSLSTVLRNPPSLTELASLSFGSGLEQGLQVVNAVFGAFLLLALSVVFAYALLAYDGELSTVFETLVGGRETTVHTYALAVDDDLESVFFGNVLFVVIMSVVATVTYAATNLVAPPGLTVPMVLTLGFLTGAASLIPVVVGKVVYLPLVAYLAFDAIESGGSLLFVGGALLVYVFVLDVLPQSFVQPYVSGRQLDTLILLFAYILGPVLFGWYGFFLLPIVFVLMLETIRIVLPELLHGDPIDPEADVAEDTGADPQEVRTDTPSEESASNDNQGAVNS
ncbi:AI-2E family transporter [Salinigranum sp. GCM10025319]|uniref:AI-2E family transporter n=1 Tax=Salinigranum sp. GCM10025319 TaxID=3252687 RepID=UPI00360F68B0